MRIPSSSSHALIGGILGAAWMRAGPQVVQAGGLLKTLISLFASPILGFIFGFLVLRLIFMLSWNATPRINEFFKRSQIFTALVAGGYLDTFAVPFWVMTLSALALSLGTTIGGWRLIHRVGASLYKIRPMDGFATQLTSSIVIITASPVGGPVSATQVIDSAIMGIGAAERANKVRWGIAQEVVFAWFLTIPATGFLAAGMYLLIVRFIS